MTERGNDRKGKCPRREMPEKGKRPRREQREGGREKGEGKCGGGEGDMRGGGTQRARDALLPPIRPTLGAAREHRMRGGFSLRYCAVQGGERAVCAAAGVGQLSSFRKHAFIYSVK